MKLKKCSKAAICLCLSASMLITAVSANAAVKDEIPVKAVISSDYTDTYKAYLSGKVEVDENSGVKIAPYAVSGTALQPSQALPSSYKTQTTGIRNQGSHNTCWAFSGIGTLEAALSANGKGDIDLSEQHLAWWATAYLNGNNGTGWLHESFNFGGYSRTSAGYFASWQGPKLESQMPYITTSNSYPSDMNDYENAYNVTEIIYVHNDIDSIKTAIYQYGGVATSYNNGSCYNSDRSAYYGGDVVTKFSGHAITVIGWDDNYSKDNFDESNKPPADGAWLVKNSWGENRGDNGYLWISYYDLYAFNTDVWGVNLAFKSVRTATGYDKMYQNERYGATYFMSMENSHSKKYSELTFVNVFDFDSEHKYLQNVIFETINEGSDYSVYYMPVENDKPVTDKSRWYYLSGGKVNNSGYIKTNINNVILPKGKGAIGVTIDGTAVNDYASLGVDEWLRTKDKKTYIFKPDPKRGDSFIIADDKAYDLLDVYAANDDDIGGTLVIKAIATTNIIGDVDGDTSVTTADALRILRNSVGIESFDEMQQINADVNFDNEIDSLDALEVLRKTVNLISDF